jgi:hypothetical protein
MCKIGISGILVLLACAWADAGEQGRLARPANSKAPAPSEQPKYLIFWHDPEQAAELPERVGMKGDGKTRLLGFGVPTPTYEIEQQLPSRIRSAFAAAREHDLAVMLHFDFHLAWKKRPDLWNWFDPEKPGYNPDNKYNVEWHGWDGPPNKVHYLNHGVLERLPPNMCLTSKRNELEKHGNPASAGVEANAGIPGSVVDWETYLGWHYNHGCVLVGVNMGATGTDLPRRLRDSAFGKEAVAAYHKFLTGQPLMEKPVSRDQPQLRIQAKMKRVRAGIERWHTSGKDPRAVGKLMEGAQPLANSGKLNELEKLVDRALEMLGEPEKLRDVHRQE